MNAQQLLINGLQDLIDGGIAILVPVVIHYILTKVSKAKLEKNSALALSIVKSLQAANNANIDVQKLASEKLTSITKGKLSTDDISHLIGSAMYEIQKDTVTALNTEQTTIPIQPNVPEAVASKT